jgi:hypothetical protein
MIRPHFNLLIGLFLLGAAQGFLQTVLASGSQSGRHRGVAAEDMDWGNTTIIFFRKRIDLKSNRMEIF